MKNILSLHCSSSHHHCCNADGNGPHDEFYHWCNPDKNNSFLERWCLVCWGFFPSFFFFIFLIFFLFDSPIWLRHCKQLYQKSWGDGRIWCWGRNEWVGTLWHWGCSLVEFQFCRSLIQAITMKQNPRLEQVRHKIPYLKLTMFFTYLGKTGRQHNLRAEELIG